MSEHLLCVTAQDFQTQCNVVDPTPRMDTEVAAEQRWIKNGESFLIWIAVSWKDLRQSSAVMITWKNKWNCWSKFLHFYGLLFWRCGNVGTSISETVLTLLCTFSLWEFSSNTLLQECPSWLTVTENSVTIIWVKSDRAPWVTTPVMRFTFPKSTCSHSWGLLFWGQKDNGNIRIKTKTIPTNRHIRAHRYRAHPKTGLIK